MRRRILNNRNGTAEIVGTVLFLVIIFFFFSNVFLWHNQISQEMNQIIADKTDSAIRLETTALLGTPNTTYSGIQDFMGQGGFDAFQFRTGINKALIADLRFSICANFIGDLDESCFVQILDSNHVPVDTGLRVLNGSLTWSYLTLSSPSSYIDGDGNVTIRIVDASSSLGYLNISYMAVFADPVALEITNLGGSDAALSRLWVVNPTDHTPYDLNGTLVAGGSSRTIIVSNETTLIAGNSNFIVVDCAPLSGQTVTFRVLTTLGNTAACSYSFP